MELPKILVDYTKEGNSILFLGAGASRDSLHPDNIQPPSASELSRLIADKYLGKKFYGRPLPNTAELAISESDLFTFQEFIAGIFEDFRPAEFHKLIPKFSWKLLATTNFDLIVERAYSEIPDSIQTLAVFKKNGERIEERLRSDKNVIFLKLHGCISDIFDEDLRLILTPDQYATHLDGRSRLFERLESNAYEYPIIFVGYSLADPDIRAILLRLDAELGEARPRSYIVTPKTTKPDKRFWDSRRITTLEGTFEDFLTSLDAAIPSQFRAITPLREKPEHPLYSRFNPELDADPSPRLQTLITRDLEYVNKEITGSELDPEAFYKGYFIDWTPIINELDAPRSVTDNILSEVFLTSESEKPEKQELYVIRGHAGSGKSVILSRIAWNAAIHFEKICLKANLTSHIEYEPIVELYRQCDQRIFLFFDPANDFTEIIEDILVRAQHDEIPITIIGAVRSNEWNIQCENLEPFVTDFYQIRYLSEKEIKFLIDLLKKHKSLGYLKSLSRAEQVEELSERAGRQLLVALHEATLGKPFEDIIYDEYESITSLRAKSLYLTVCIFSMLGVSARAGLISRVHGIPFTEFEERLHEPLELIVFANFNKLTRDYEYRARHNHIADIVFERVLSDPEDRFAELSRIINALDVDFSSDMDAFRNLMNGRRLLSIFNDPQMIRQLFEIARSRTAPNEKILQQEAIFEMNAPGGDLNRATGLLEEANKIAPHYKPVKHSLAVLAVKKSEEAKTPLEQAKHRENATKLSRGLISDGTYSSHPYHTLIVVAIDNLEAIIEEADARTIESHVKDLERIIAIANQKFPDDSYLLDAQARFNELLNREEAVLEILRRAFRRNVRDPYIASRLSDIYAATEMYEDAIEVLKKCLEANASNKTLHFRLAMLMAKLPEYSDDDIRYHLRRSFTIGDTNFAAQFWYARSIYLTGEIDKAKEIFEHLSKAKIHIRIRREPRGKVVINNTPIEFSGTLIKKEASYAFIARDKYQDIVFTHKRFNDHWDKLRPDMRVKFNLAFNYRGPFALNTAPET